MLRIDHADLEKIAGGRLTVSEGVGLACAATVAIGIFGGLGGLAFALIVGPTVCVGGGVYAGTH